MIRRAWSRCLDWLVGPLCDACGTRVLTKDTTDHYRVCTRRPR